MSIPTEFIFVLGTHHFTAVFAENMDEACARMREFYGENWFYGYDSRQEAGVKEFNLIELTFGEKP